MRGDVDGAPEDVEEMVLDAFRRCFMDETLDRDVHFLELGGTSLQAMQLVHALSRRIGTQIPTDILFHYATPRELAAFLNPQSVETPHDGGNTVVFRRDGRGRPVFLVPALYPSPWVFLPLVEAMDLARPIYGLRSPELDWRGDVLTMGELIAYYVTEIRRLQPKGPYSLVGYSFGGLVAFEIAVRLARDDDVHELILLDTAAPPRGLRRAVRRLKGHALLNALLGALARHGVVDGRTLARAGVASPLYRASLAFAPGPLTEAAVRMAIRLVDPRVPIPAGADLDLLAAMLLSLLKTLAPASEWQAVQHTLPMRDDDPLAAIKAFTVMMNNRAAVRRHRLRDVFDGVITVFSTDANPNVGRWQRYSSRPLKVMRVPAAGYNGQRTHMAFLDARNVRLYVDALTAALGREPDRERMTA
jgi:pimeloyl-ACP methyl ester carboxylesterase